MDALSDILALVRLKGVVYFRRDFAAPWGMEMGRSAFAQFHLIVRGHCILEHAGRAPVALSAGDILMFPRGDPHALADQPKRPKVPGIQVLDKHLQGEPIFLDGDVTTTMVCGHFAFDPRFAHPLLDQMPPLIHLTQAAPHELSWLETVTAAIIQETDSGRAGATAVVERLAEVLFVQILRAFMASRRPRDGMLAALRDERISRALKIIHDCADENLSLDKIARAVGMSRSAFAERFRALTGQAPIGYLTDWRMLKARELLEETGEPIDAICARVGYQSEAAFNRAFKRRYGRGPGALRRAARTGTGA